MRQPLRIVSYNVRYFGHALRGLASTARSKRGIAERLAALDPQADVICLQEVETISMRSSLAHRAAHDEETQLEAFMACLEEAFAREVKPFPYEALYFPADTIGPRAMPVYTTGLVVLVNVKRLRIEGHNAASPHTITHHHVARFKDRKQIRICAHVHLLDPHGRRFHVFNTHMSLPTPFVRDFWGRGGKMGFGPNQLAEAHALATFVSKHADGHPFVIGGDFNTAPFSPVFQYLVDEVGLDSAQLRLGQLNPGDPRAFPTAGFMRLRMHLDHLFAGGGVRWLDVESTRPFGDPKGPFHGLSDHVPLIARFELPRVGA